VIDACAHRRGRRATSNARVAVKATAATQQVKTTTSQSIVLSPLRSSRRAAAACATPGAR
jgi:hypothetical protein